MTNKIDWRSEGVEMPAIDQPFTERWLKEVASRHNRLLGPIVYLFCNDDKILEVNKQFLSHDYYTDIITFDYSRGRLISGDIVISLDTVASNAEQFATDPHRELLRVIAHGVLHLCGIDDKGPGEREIMESHENEALELFYALEKEK